MLIITLCILYIFCAVFSRGVHSHPRVNVHCVFAAASLASVFHLTLLFPCVCSSWCKDADRAGGAAAVQVFEGMPFQFHVGSWTSGFSEWHFRPRVYPCVLWGVCARAWSSCHGVLITTSHTCFPPRRSTPPQPTRRTSHVSCLTIKGRSSPSCWFLFPCMGSSPSVELVWLGFNSPPLSPCISLWFQSEKILQETCDSQRRDNYAAQKRLPSVRMDW